MLNVDSFGEEFIHDGDDDVDDADDGVDDDEDDDGDNDDDDDGDVGGGSYASRSRLAAHCSTWVLFR